MNFLYYFLGLIILFLNKIRYGIFGYKNPRNFSVKEIKKSVDYDLAVVKGWQEALKKYIGSNEIKNKNILELGPGPDLGTGLILLASGAKKYNLLDLNNLAFSSPVQFYQELFKRLPANKIEFLEAQLALTMAKKNDCLNYLVDKKFSFSALAKEKIDLIFSQAAFEHFSEVGKTIEELSEVAESGAILVAEIDLRTHTEFLVKRDPLNIYRYRDSIYNIFKFSGIPNRLRLNDYQEILEKNGWTDIRIYPLEVLSEEKFKKVKNNLAKKFKNQEKEMKILKIHCLRQKSLLANLTMIIMLYRRNTLSIVLILIQMH